MKEYMGVKVGFTKPTDSPNQTADRSAILDDLQFSLECLRELACCEESENPAISRALWEASLISFRRSMANAHTMGPESGGVESPLSRKHYRSILPPELHVNFEMYMYYADKTVAHRKPIKNIREINEMEFQGIKSTVSTHAEPEQQDIDKFMEVVEFLYDFVIEN